MKQAARFPHRSEHATNDETYMGRALRLAARGSGQTNPNPLVGCVIVRHGRVVAEAYHTRAGMAHAEVLALKRAGAQTRGATLYVNLEPCSHHGKTPPCAPVVAAAGVARVVVATRDPNPRVQGRGLRLLRGAGVSVAVGVLKAQAQRLNRRFLAGIALKRPYVTLKVAMTVDGRIATSAGQSRWITLPRQRRSAKELRREHDAVMVGIGTVLADDPLLLPLPSVRRPYPRVVTDSHLRIPLQSQLVQTALANPLVVLCDREADADRRRALEALGVNVWPIPSTGGRLDLRSALRRLRSSGIVRLMVEGGGELLGSFVAGRLFDEIVIYRAPIVLGGRNSRPAFGGPDPKRLAASVPLRPAPAGETPAFGELWYVAKRRSPSSAG